MSTTPDVTIRRATEKDLDGAARLAAQLVAFHHELEPTRFFDAQNIEPGYRRFLSTQLEKTDAVFLVAVSTSANGSSSDEKVIGYAYGKLEPKDFMALRDPCGFLHDLFIDENARQGGLAKKLVAAMAEEMKKLGSPKLMLHTAWNNHKARKLFESMGFKPTMVEMMMVL